MTNPPLTVGRNERSFARDGSRCGWPSDRSVKGHGSRDDGIDFCGYARARRDVEQRNYRFPELCSGDSGGARGRIGSTESAQRVGDFAAV